MSNHSDKLVAVIDPIWIGHHPMYFAQFVASFLRHGTRVIALCPEPEDARREVLESIDETTAATLDQRVLFRKLEIGSRSFFNGRFEGDPLRTTLRWKNAAEAMNQAEAELGRDADFVYFPYLDTYLRFLPFRIAPEILLGRKWSGLYLRNHHHGNPSSLKQSLILLGKGDALLRSESCLGIGVLDERFIPAMERYTCKPVSLFPDFTNSSLPAQPTTLAQQILHQAAGRKIIGMIGLERRKGILTLLKTAQLAREKNLPYFFVCGGRIFREEFSEERWSWIETMSEADNVHLDLGAERIPSEAGFNSVFSTFDVAWAAYEQFQGSSNTLGKAAAFEIPCVASESGCVGYRVAQYRTGLTIPEADSEKALEAISRLSQGIDWQGDPIDFGYESFRQQHSIARLDQLVGDLLAKL